MFRCCNSCTFCLSNRAITKERLKSRLRSSPNKACERCFYCKSFSFCPKCGKCPQCCRNLTCGRQVATFLAHLGLSGFESQSGLDFERLCLALQNQATSYQISNDCEQIYKPPPGFSPAGSFAFPPAKTSGRRGSGLKFPSFLQLPLSGSQTKQQLASHSGSKHLKPILKGKVIQDGDPHVRTAVPPSRRVGNVAGLQRRVLPHSHSPSVKEIPRVPLPSSNLPIQGPPLRPFDGSFGVHSHDQGG